jgi:hypothetical protein
MTRALAKGVVLVQVVCSLSLVQELNSESFQVPLDSDKRPTTVFTGLIVGNSSCQGLGGMFSWLCRSLLYCTGMTDTR